MNAPAESGSARALNVVQALDALAHDIRNATANVATGARLMDGAPADEVVEIAQDMQDPAQSVLLMVDLAVEASRACLRTADPEPLDLHAVVQRSIGRSRRGGIDVTGALDAVGVVHVLAIPSAIERCITAAAMYLGSHVSMTGSGSSLVLRAVGDDAPSDQRQAGARLLCEVLADAAGATVTFPDADPTTVSIVFTPA